jgi:HAD superfamily hydrolase (TIGR01549 family)
LGNSVDVFLHRYFTLLADFARELMPPDQFLKELLFATQAVIANQDPLTTNREVFWSVFSRQTALDQATTEPFLDRFYREEFSQLQVVTECRPVAQKLVQLVLDRGLKVVIATNPLFPRIAIEQRLAWAGIPVATYPLDLVTAYENMHATKPHAAYYQEILDVIGVQPSQALMVGDDWKNDIYPATRLGLSTYWIARPESDLPDPAVNLMGRGSLDDLYRQFSNGWLVERPG